MNPFTVLHCTGPKVAEFLQKQLTCDVLALQEKQWQWCAYCSQKGRVFASGWLVRPEQETYHWIVSHDIAHSVMERLNHYGQFNRIQTSISALPAYISTAQALSFTNNQYSFPLSQAFSLCVGGTHHPHPQWQDQLILLDLHLITQKTQDKFTAHMLNFQKGSAISFTKGCYLGQEIIARTQHLGQVKRQSYCLKVPHPIEIDSEVYDNTDKKIGNITACGTHFASAVLTTPTRPLQTQAVLVEVVETKSPLECSADS